MLYELTQAERETRWTHLTRRLRIGAFVLTLALTGAAVSLYLCVGYKGPVPNPQTLEERYCDSSWSAPVIYFGILVGLAISMSAAWQRRRFQPPGRRRDWWRPF